jgi:predicted O-methyltransferase YrrM
MLRKPIATEP